MSNALNITDIIGVVGSGAMGSGIAQVAAAAGHSVMLYDARPEAVDCAVASIRDTFAKLVGKGRMAEAAAQAASERLQAARFLSDLAPRGMVVEVIVEDLEAKRTLFNHLEDIVGKNCILATNTSSISVTAIGARKRNPARMAGMHSFNPVPLMALVEVVSAWLLVPTWQRRCTRLRRPREKARSIPGPLRGSS